MGSSFRAAFFASVQGTVTQRAGQFATAAARQAGGPAICGPAKVPESQIAVSNKTRAFAAVAVMGLLTAFLWTRLRGTQFAWGLFVHTLAGVRGPWLGTAIGFVFLSYWARALRWQAMLRPLRAHAPISRLLRATLIGFAAVVLLGRPGEPVRPYLIATQEKVSFSSQMAIWLLERIFDLLMVLAIFGFALAMAPAGRLHLGPSLRLVFRIGGYLSAGVGVLCLALLFGFRHFSEASGSRMAAAEDFLPASFREKAQTFTRSFAEGMGATMQAGLVARITAYSVLLWALLLVANSCMFSAFPATSGFSLTQAAVYLGLVSFGGAVQLPGIGGGVQVASILVLTEIFGLRIEAASALALLLWAAGYLPVVPVGLWLAVRQGIGWGITKKIKEDVPV